MEGLSAVSGNANRCIVPTPKILPCGDSALTIEFGDTIDPDINGMVLALDDIIRARAPAGLLETVPTYRSLTVQFDPAETDYEALIRLVNEETKDLAPRKAVGRRWRVPVVYGGEYGSDLEEVAETHGMTPAQVIEIHASAIYRIYMIGFLPGFTYLGGLDKRIATSRRVQPRAKIPVRNDHDRRGAGRHRAHGYAERLAQSRPDARAGPMRRSAIRFSCSPPATRSSSSPSTPRAGMRWRRRRCAGEPVAEEMRP